MSPIIIFQGASDDAVTCCLMMEVLDILSQKQKPLLHNIIFIFNGAEENILQVAYSIPFESFFRI